MQEQDCALFRECLELISGSPPKAERREAKPEHYLPLPLPVLRKSKHPLHSTVRPFDSLKRASVHSYSLRPRKSLCPPERYGLGTTHK